MTDVDRALLAGLAAMLTMWFWAPILRRFDIEDARVAQALFVVGIIATAIVASAGMVLLITNLPGLNPG